MNDTNIEVAVRKRRLLKNEIVSNPPLEVDGNTVKVDKKSFTYDYVFGENSTNQEVYERVIKDKIKNLFEGFNVTILAYGSTGSGKTFTMGTDHKENSSSEKVGKENSSPEKVGIIPRGLNDIFERIKTEEGNDFVVKVSFLEIYNEDVYDLGIDKGQKNKLHILDYEGTASQPPFIEVTHLTQKVVHNTKEALNFLMKGSKQRRTGETAKNKYSSRSHAILNVVVQQSDITGSRKSAKFQLVDLAGSERSSISQTSGLRLKEGSKINKGLFQLSKVIRELTTSKAFVDYRSSKLTHILKDSLGGNTYTVMIACVNPSSTSFEQTLSTLRYAQNAREIKNNPMINVNSATDQLKQLKKENEALSAELNTLRTMKLSAADIISDNKALQMLKSECVKVNSLKEKLLELQAGNRSLKERMRAFYEILKAVVLDMKSAADTADDIDMKSASDTADDMKSQMEILESIRDECYELLMKDVNINVEDGEDYKNNEKDGEDYKNNETFNEDESELNKSGDASEEKSDEVKDRQISSNNELNSINKALDLKENICKELFLQDNTNCSVVETKNQLESQIQQLMQEKEELIQTMEKEKMDSKENAEKVAKYEQQLKKLQNELDRVKNDIHLQSQTRAKVDKLTEEIKELKKNRVDVMKQISQASNILKRMEQEKNEDILKLKKKEQQNQVQVAKMTAQYKSKIRVLEARVSKYELSDIHRFKNINIKTEKLKQPQANTEESIEEKLKIAVENNLIEIELKEMIDEAENLQQQIKKIEELSPSDENKACQSTDVHEMKGNLKALLEKISTMSNVPQKKAKQCVLLDTLSNLSTEEKAVINTLFDKCVTAKVDFTKYQEKCNEKSKKKNDDMERKMFELTNESEKVTQELEKKIIDLENKLCQKNIDDLKNQEAKDPDEEIQTLQAACDKKHAEIAQLEKKLGDLRKKRKWLTKFSFEDIDAYQPSEVPEEASMLEEFLNTDNEESFTNDPDWRATPIHKQAKRRRIETSAESRAVLKTQQGEAGPSTIGSIEAMDTSENDFLLPVKPTCQCEGDCKTKSCRCQKRNLFCSNACGCITDRCMNMDPNV